MEVELILRRALGQDATIPALVAKVNREGIQTLNVILGVKLIDATSSRDYEKASQIVKQAFCFQSFESREYLQRSCALGRWGHCIQLPIDVDQDVLRRLAYSEIFAVRPDLKKKWTAPDPVRRYFARRSKPFPPSRVQRKRAPVTTTRSQMEPIRVTVPPHLRRAIQHIPPVVPRRKSRPTLTGHGRVLKEEEIQEILKIEDNSDMDSE